VLAAADEKKEQRKAFSVVCGPRWMDNGLFRTKLFLILGPVWPTAPLGKGEWQLDIATQNEAGQDTILTIGMRYIEEC
jgi:hypothetical protein